MTDEKTKLKRYTLYVVIAAAAVLTVLHFGTVVGAVGKFFGIISPLIIGGVLAYVFNLIMRRIEKAYFPKSDKKIVQASRRPVCLVLSIFALFVIIGLISVLILPEISNIISVFKATVPYYYDKFRLMLINHQEDLPFLQDYIQKLVSDPEIDWQKILSAVIDFATTGVGGFITSTVSILSSVFGGIVNFAIGMIFAIYILYNKEKLALQADNLLKCYVNPVFADKFRYFCRTADKCFSSFIVGQCTEAVILGVLCALGMTILRIPYATTIGTLIGATALIPIVGAYIGAVAGVLMIIVADPIKALWFVIFLVILQQVEGNVIYPKVVGSSVGLPGMWVLAAVTVGGSLGGVGGMLMGVPLTATIYTLIDNDVNKKLKNNGEKAKSDKACEAVTEPIVTEEAPAAAEIRAEEKPPAKMPAQNQPKRNNSSNKSKKSGRKR